MKFYLNVDLEAGDQRLRMVGKGLTDRGELAKIFTVRCFLTDN